MSAMTNQHLMAKPTMRDSNTSNAMLIVLNGEHTKRKNTKSR
jgi:hypothetical protein